MAALDLQYDIVNDTAVDASPVEANFNRIEAHVNTELINRDGSVAMTAPLRLSGNPVNDLDAVPKGFMDTVTPIGTITMFGGSAAPPGGKWLLCDGASLSTATYAGLFAVIGTSYGGDSGSFNLPNLVGRFPVGHTNVAPTLPIGSTGGSRDAAVPTHSHPIDHTHPATASGAQSADHTHVVPAHGHNMSHGHAPVESVAGEHSHTIPTRENPTSGSAGSIGLSNAGGTIVNDRTTSTVAGHTHGAYVEHYTGETSAWTGATSGVSVTHTHTTTLPAFTGTSGDAGVTPVGANMPPYVAISFIIKAA